MFTPQLLLAGLVGIFLATYLPALFFQKAWQKAMKPFLTDRVYTRILGFFILFIGYFFLSLHWKLTGDWLMLISIIGWLTVLKGVLFMWFPDHVKRMSKKTHLSSLATTRFIAFLALVISAALIYCILEVPMWWGF